MRKIVNFLLTCIKVLSGVTLLILVIIFWATALALSSLIDIITWVEKALTRLMKKCLDDENLN
tara:strand:- start:1672 stop:1860 length:189 start_codon:yes stop_codon:yes gene_type:complete